MKVFLMGREKKFFFALWTHNIFPALLGIGIGVFLLLGSGKGILAQDPSSMSARIKEALEGEGKGKETPVEIWQAYRQFVLKGEWNKSGNELEKLYQWKLNQGIRNHYYYAIALLRESQKLSKEAGKEMGSILLSYAKKMAPDFSEVYYAQSQWIWARQPFSLTHLAQAVWYWLEGGFYSYANIEEAIPQYANLGYGVVLGFLMALSLFAAILAFRYYPFFHHHLRHLLNVDLHPIAQALLGILLLFLPFALGIGWLGLLLAWLLAFWVYQTREERTVTLAVLVLVLLLPSAVRVSSSFVSSLIGNGVPEIIRANNGVWSPQLHRQLLVLQQRQTGDPDLLQAVSLVEKRMGKFPEAEQHLRRWIQLDGESAAAYNNLGNVYLATNRVDQAIEAYQKAIRLDSIRTEAYYNLGQAYLLNLLLNEAESEFRRAKELRPQLISFYTSIASRHPNRMTIDRSLEPLQIWKRVLGETRERERLESGFWAFFGSGFPLPFGEIFGITSLLVLGVIHRGRRRRPLIRRCERCGRLICSRCSRSLVIGNQCLQCIKAFAKNPSGDSQQLKEKRLEVARHQLSQFALSRWLSFVLPGAGHLHRGHAKEGFIYIFIGSLFLTKTILWERWVPNPLDLGISSPIPWVGAALLLFLIFYGWVQFRLLQILRREAKFYFRPAE